MLIRNWTTKTRRPNTETRTACKQTLRFSFFLQTRSRKTSKDPITFPPSQSVIRPAGRGDHIKNLINSFSLKLAYVIRTSPPFMLFREPGSFCFRFQQTVCSKVLMCYAETMFQHNGAFQFGVRACRKQVCDWKWTGLGFECRVTNTLYCTNGKFPMANSARFPQAVTQSRYPKFNLFTPLVEFQQNVARGNVLSRCAANYLTCTIAHGTSGFVSS